VKPPKVGLNPGFFYNLRIDINAARSQFPHHGRDRLASADKPPKNNGNNKYKE